MPSPPPTPRLRLKNQPRRRKIMFVKSLSFVVGFIGVFWLAILGGWGVYWYDHRPQGEPSWGHVHFLFWRYDLPPSLAAQRDIVLAKQLKAEAAQRTLMDALAQQNARLAALSSAGADAQAKAEKAVAGHVQAQQRAMDLRQAIKALPDVPPGDDCQALQASDAALVAYLKGARP